MMDHGIIISIYKGVSMNKINELWTKWEPILTHYKIYIIFGLAVLGILIIV